MKDNFCYVHIPFCTSKCKYCRFASFGNTDAIKINLYVEKLLEEINKSSFTIIDNTIKSIYFGGGTPSVLSVKQLKDIIEALKSKYTFDENIEINIEATPITVTPQNLIGWNDIGINRLSIGVQTLNTNSLNEIGRGEKGDIISALDYILESKIDFNVSIDFIIGLPHVKKGEIKNDIEYLLHNYYYVKHVSVYMLEEYYNQGIDENDNSKNDSKFQNIVYPKDWENLGLEEDFYLEEYIEIKDYLNLNGYYSYEVSNFAKSGYECRHNKSYWDHSHVFAFGLGAHGFINNIRYSNSESFLGYYNGLKDDFELLDSNDLFMEKIMFGLRTNGLSEDLYKKLDIEKINYFLKEGLLQKKSDKVILSDRGILLMDYVLREII